MEILTYWPWMLAALVVLFNTGASLHAIFCKRESTAAVSWIAIIWLLPVLGCLLYYVLGINRIERKARRLRRKTKQLRMPLEEAPPARLPVEAAHFTAHEELSETVSGQPLCAGNYIEPLWDGDAAYPAMLQAIEDAKHSVALCMYIFNNDRIGNRFAEALGRAVARGVAVRVLIDDIGARMTWDSIVGPLAKANAPTATFLPTLWPRYFAYANLRNHRKLLIVDGRVGFTGGMNITDECWLKENPAYPIHDLQFRIEGPIVAQMQQVFAEDWHFATGEKLEAGLWFPLLESRGSSLARGVMSGPDEDLEKLRLVLLGALTSARQRVLIVTPYFLPDAGLISALSIAALRGVEVDILLPKVSDLRLIRWATIAHLWQVLEHGCRVWHMPAPFRHTKLMLVDGVWTMLGSANWDARSLRLNFEFTVECYDAALTQALQRTIEEMLTQAELVTIEKLNRRPFLRKLRDALARLLMPGL